MSWRTYQGRGTNPNLENTTQHGDTPTQQLRGEAHSNEGNLVAMRGTHNDEANPTATAHNDYSREDKPKGQDDVTPTATMGLRLQRFLDDRPLESPIQISSRRVSYRRSALQSLTLPHNFISISIAP